MLGLRRGTVLLASHDATWADEFRRTAERIRTATGVPPGRIQHVGSTSVPDLPSKPILDIDVGIIESDDIEEVAGCLARFGYVDRGDHDGGIGRLLVWETAAEVRTVHVHVIPHDSAWWRCDLAFRDALRADAALRAKYAELKTQLARRFATDRRAYRHAKNDFLSSGPTLLGYRNR